MNEQFQLFEGKHVDVLVQWLTLVKNQRDNHWLPPVNENDLYSVRKYKNSLKHNEALSAFEKQTDKNILLTYMKYNISTREYPFTFKYSEPDKDLTV